MWEPQVAPASLGHTAFWAVFVQLACNRAVQLQVSHEAVLGLAIS